MNTIKANVTNLLLAMIFLVLAGIFINVALSGPADGSVALQGYQVRTVFLAAGDPLPITSTEALPVSLAAGDPLPVTITMPIAVIQGDADLLLVNANVQQDNVDVGIGNPLYITPTQRLEVNATTSGDLPMVPFATVLEASVELVGIDEQLAQFEWSEGTEVPLGGTYSGELLNLTVILSGTLSEADTILVFDADPSVTLADANLATASWLLAIGKYDIAAGDWFEEDSGGTGAVATFPEPIAFHPTSSLWFALYHEGSTTINSLAGNNESVTIHVEIRRDS